MQTSWLLYALAIAFKDDAHVVKTVATASAAIGELTARSYDLCLLDLNLRHPHSLRMMSIIGNLYSQTRLVVTTTCCFDLPELDGSISDALECGACHFVAKPFQLSELTGLVKHLLTAEEDLQAGSASPPALQGGGHGTAAGSPVRVTSNFIWP